jgi:hypothetical protein
VKKSKLFWFLLLVAGVMVLTGCSSTRLVSSWHDEAVPGGTFKKPLVLAIINKEAIRGKLEDQFVRELRAIGVEGLQSYRIFTDLKGVTNSTIIDRLPDLGLDCALVVRLVDVKKETVIVPSETTIYPAGGYAGPGHYNRFGTYYAYGYSVVSSPAYSYESKTYSLETNLYDARNEKLVWSAATETDNPSSIDAAVEDFVKVVMKNIAQSKLFPVGGQGR